MATICLAPRTAFRTLNSQCCCYYLLIKRKVLLFRYKTKSLNEITKHWLLANVFLKPLVQFFIYNKEMVGIFFLQIVIFSSLKYYNREIMFPSLYKKKNGTVNYNTLLLSSIFNLPILKY